MFIFDSEKHILILDVIKTSDDNRKTFNLNVPQNVPLFIMCKKHNLNIGFRPRNIPNPTHQQTNYLNIRNKDTMKWLFSIGGGVLMAQNGESLDGHAHCL